MREKKLNKIQKTGNYNRISTSHITLSIECLLEIGTSKTTSHLNKPHVVQTDIKKTDCAGSCNTCNQTEEFYTCASVSNKWLHTMWMSRYSKTKKKHNASWKAALINKMGIPEYWNINVKTSRWHIVVYFSVSIRVIPQSEMASTSVPLALFDRRICAMPRKQLVRRVHEVFFVPMATLNFVKHSVTQMFNSQSIFPVRCVACQLSWDWCATST